jgi:hypothetical protein
VKNKLRQLAVLVTPRLSRKLTCESCGKEFSCGASLTGCWCGEISLSDAHRAALKERFRDCLCRECLEKIGAETVSSQIDSLHGGTDQCRSGNTNWSKDG